VVSKPEDFPRTLTPKEQLQAAIEKGLASRRDSGRLQFLVTAPRDLLIEVLNEYKKVGWRVRAERKGSMGSLGIQGRYLLKFSRS
jgi:hypothetical protein